MLLRLIVLLMFVVLGLTPTQAARRVALVIGNNAYANLPAERQLKKAVNDARAMRDTLKAELGFDVLYGEDVDWGRMNGLIKQLETKVGDGDVVFVYFSGHGVSVGGENYLLPSDIPSPRQGEESRLIGNSFGAEAITQRIQKRGAQAIFAVLDACRDNPFVDDGGKAVGGSGGLATIDNARGVFTLFAAGLGEVALDRLSNDDPDPNSVFTRSLIPLLKTGGLSQVDLAKKVQQEVVTAAAAIGHNQMPVYDDGLLGFVALKEGGPGEPPIVTPSTDSAEEKRTALERQASTAWEAIKDSNDTAKFDAFAIQYDGTIYGDAARSRAKELRKSDIVFFRLETRWIVVAGSFQEWERSEAVQRRDKVLAAGYPAVILDSTDYALLSPGLLVVAITAKTRDQAKQLERLVKRDVVQDAYAKQAF